jgi:4-amino-4-deoxychorismate lyase
MYLLLETIRISDGKAENLSLHEERMKRSVFELYGNELSLELGKVIQCPPDLDSGIVKCRVIYDGTIRSITYEPYQPRLIRSLKLVYDDAIEYSYKYLDRNCFARLMSGIIQDDILIVKNGLITDTSYANVILSDGEQWFTPAVPLLKGTKRDFLIHSGSLLERDIRPSDLRHYTEARIINSLLDPLDNPPIVIPSIL